MMKYLIYFFVFWFKNTQRRLHSAIEPSAAFGPAGACRGAAAIGQVSHIVQRMGILID